LEESQIERWWPNGYGSQKLFDLEVNFVAAGSPEKTTKNIRVAFRFFPH
jgi:hypothetical protein